MALYDVGKIKSVGQFQANFMWSVEIPTIPSVGANSELRFTARTTNIPAYTREKTIIRYEGRQYTQPAGVTHDAEWTLSILLDETHVVYDRIVQWCDLIDSMVTGKVGASVIKTTATVTLLGLNKTVVNKQFTIDGIYPLNYPEITDLAQENNEGQISFDVNFAYDSIDYLKV